ncbi:hypothetical protein Taro_035922 [Colocasia esculenta]|uniref:Uncharacterized protein n=1 Tax=Colocasia esculenta TaxID=4460 RepID=A0A843W586_COLES|nr:hypothetical protein [Colocasia esculenta]
MGQAHFWTVQPTIATIHGPPNYSATAWAPRREEGEKMAGRREAAMRLWRRAGEESGSDDGRGSWMGGVLFHHAPKSLHLPVAVRTGGDGEETQEEQA